MGSQEQTELINPGQQAPIMGESRVKINFPGILYVSYVINVGGPPPGSSPPPPGRQLNSGEGIGLNAPSGPTSQDVGIGRCRSNEK